MSIFEDRDWSKEDIINAFQSRNNLCNQIQLAYCSSNGEVEYNGCWYMYFELEQLLEILN